MFLIDTHCHLSDEYYPNGISNVLKNALNSGVKRLVLASENVASSKNALSLALAQTTEPYMRVMAGVHPHEASKVTINYIDELKDTANSDKVVAIGEIGLDYFYDNSPRDIQREVFTDQIKLAKSIDKPIILHIRDAADPALGDANACVLKILAEQNADKIGGIVHCFSGDMNTMKEAVELGFYISFAGSITYPKNVVLREIAMEVPMDRILCETDSPFLSPQGYRGKPNEPCRVRQVYETIAMLKCVSLEYLADAAADNVQAVLRWNGLNV